MKAYQKKLLIYGVSAAFCFITASLLSGVVFSTETAYAFFWGILSGGIGVTVARLVYHLVLKDYAPEMWQITVYMLLSCGGWLGGILATSWGWTTFWLSVMCVGIIMAAGTRFCRRVSETRVQNSLETTLRYRYIDDKLGGTPDLDSPLTVVVNGQALTVEEAENEFTDEPERLLTRKEKRICQADG